MTMTPTDRAQTLTQRVATQIRIEMAKQDGLRQSQLARRIGRTEQWLSVRLRGVQPIDLNDLQEIADGLAVPVARLLPEPGEVRSISPTSTAPNGQANRPPDTRPPGRPDGPNRPRPIAH